MNALQNNHPTSLPFPSLLAAVDRVAQGQALDVTPVPVAVPPEPVVEAPVANAPDWPETVAEADLLAETGTVGETEEAAAVPEGEATVSIDMDVAADAEAVCVWLALSAVVFVVAVAALV